jgi:hypothetical protein
MTASGDTLAAISPYTVGATGTVTQAQFDLIAAMVKGKLDREKPPTMSAADYDLCHALLIADKISRKVTDGSINSESFPDYSYSRRADTRFTSDYMRDYQDVMASYATKPSGSIDRVDRNNRAFRLTETTLPTIGE